ncbi:MAG: HAMP domain-containing protein [Anaerolineae bacterium]|nr:HAMP domain-containing protein [Anaerolineae bacterium]
MGQKLMATFLIVILMALGITGLISVNTSREALLGQGTTNLLAVSHSTSNAIDQYLFMRREDIATASAFSEIVAFATNPKDNTARVNALQVLKTLAKKIDYESIAIADREGTIILFSSEQDLNTNIKASPYFVEPMKGIVGYISDPAVSAVTNKPALFFSAAIRDPAGQALGVLVSRLSLSGIWTIVENDLDAAGPGTVGILLDEYGLRLAHSTSKWDRAGVEKNLLFHAIAPVPDQVTQQFILEKRFGTATIKSIPVRPLAEIARAMQNPVAGVFETSADSSPARHYAVMTSLRIKPWRYVVMAPIPTFTSAADTLGFQLLVFAALIAALTSIVVILLTRTFTRPIVQLTQVADRLSLGELDVPIPIDRKDEIGELAEAIRRMQASIQVAMERLRARRA